MSNRTDWKALHAEKVARINQLEAELAEAVQSGLSLGKENDELRERIAQLNKQVGRAKLEGAKGLAEFLLESE